MTWSFFALQSLVAVSSSLQAVHRWTLSYHKPGCLMPKHHICHNMWRWNWTLQDVFWVQHMKSWHKRVSSVKQAAVFDVFDEGGVRTRCRPAHQDWKHHISLLIRSHTCGKAIGSNLEFMQLELSMNWPTAAPPELLENTDTSGDTNQYK